MKSSSKKYFTFAIRFSIGFLILGIMFKIMHWPMAKPILILSLSSIGLFSIAKFLVTKPKLITDYIKLSLTISFIFYYGLGLLRLPGKSIAGIVLLISFFLWIWFDGLKLNSGKTISEKIPNTLLIAGGILTVAGMIFKIMHWPLGGILLVVGILFVAISFFSGAFRDR